MRHFILAMAIIFPLSFINCSREKEFHSPVLAQPEMIEEGKNAWLIRWTRFQGKEFETYEIYRSIRPLGSIKYVDWDKNPIIDYPVTRIRINGQSDTSYIDSMLGHSTQYYYVVFATTDDSYWQSNIVSIGTPDKDLKTEDSYNIRIVVDKSDYLLSIHSGNTYLKRYPIALGKDPVTRKLHWDRKTTPEGKFRVDYKLDRGQSDFYRAFHFNYPNAEDKRRYNEAIREGRISRNVGIGGDIEIHGGGISRNWTWGCVAMRDEDIDELWPIIKGGKRGTSIIINH